jgi:transcriptional regulator with XRE-family HTH domain
VPSKPNKSPKAHAAFFTGLGQRLKTMREDRGWRQEDMLSHGFSVRHWQRIEAGKSITVSTLLRIADAFAQPPETIIAGPVIAGPAFSNPEVSLKTRFDSNAEGA